jgi:D-tyrosyl-tRNA(Tyr) deacylase
MRALVQRVSEARVRVADEVVGEVGRGLLVLVGVGHEDDEQRALALAKKVSHLRVFEDEAGKMNLSTLDVGGALLVVSQFTLYGDCARGRRPSFAEAGRPERAEPLFERFVEAVRAEGLRCETGRFRTHMEVELINDGPVTLWLEL